ncbi:MAG: hypothetical protein JWP94_470 [Mucilaginibacter sp.]|nr:hypothetical protein [Mucilaginibacter sp.]
MVKASALYIVIIITLVIGVICSALIASAYFYRLEYQKKFRYDQLQNNLNSGVNILMAGDNVAFTDGKTFSLFNNGADSVWLKRTQWGVYDVGVCRAFIEKDSLFKAFTIANTLDSSKWAALYLIDEDRPLSLGGQTNITGDAFIPKAGVTTAFVDNQAYQGDKRLITGHKYSSGKKLPLLSQKKLDGLRQLYTQTHLNDSLLVKRDSVSQSFLLPTRYFNFGKQIHSLSNVRMGGNIVLLSDTTVTIDSTASLDNIIIYARSIAVKSGFHGNCQLFATDSIGIDSNCHFSYPSCLGILRFDKSAINAPQEKISLGNRCSVNGLMFTYEKAETAVKPMIAFGKNVKISGQVYSQALVEFTNHTEIDGSVFTARFLYRNSFTLYENYLINITIDPGSLSPYYLTSDLIPVAAKRKKVLQWLEGN